jgi:hypothetical protein
VAGKNVIVKRKSLKFRKAFSQVWQIRIVNANARTKTFATTHAFFERNFLGLQFEIEIMCFPIKNKANWFEIGEILSS